MISKKCEYALLAMLELATRKDGGPVTIGDIARARGIPPRFLEAILRQLKLAGLAESARGKDGGYFLPKPADKLPVSAVIELFESGPGRKPRDASHDVFSALWREADAAAQAVYRRVTFGDLLEKEIQRHHAEAGNYAI